MKNLKKMKSLLFVAVLFGGLLSSCKKDKDVVKDQPADKNNCQLVEITSNSGPSETKTTLTYNASKQLVESSSIHFGIRSGAKYTYNAANQIILKEETEGENKDVTWKVSYNYSGNLVHESKSYYYDGSDWIMVEIRRYEYQNGHLAKVRYFNVFGGNEIETAYLVYDYDANHNVKSIIGFSKDMNNEWMETSRRTLTYVAKTAPWSLITQLTEDPNFPATQLIASDKSEEWDEDNQIWETTENITYSYTYNDKGLPLTMTIPGIGTGNLTYTCN